MTGRSARVALLLVLVAAGAWAADTVAEARARFDEALSAGSDADAQAAGRRLLADFPEDPTCLYVLRELRLHGWKWPRLKTSFETLKRWERDEVDGAQEPDLRLALIDALEDLYPREDHVREGGTLYERAWTLLQAGRLAEAAKTGREYLRRFPDGTSADKVRLVIAEALLRDGDLDGARKVLEPVVENAASKHRERALRMLDEMAAGARWIEMPAGFPRAVGLGRTVLLTDLPADGREWKALAPWREARRADVVRFRGGRVKETAAELRRMGPEFVAVAVPPAELDANLQWDLVELCRDLDEDPMPDFLFGYLVARDAADLAALGERSVASAPRPAAKMSVAALSRSLAGLAPLDGVLHFGHGTPTGVVDGADAADVAAVDLPGAPLVVSGACYNGAVGRSWHPCTLQEVFCRPVEYRPDQVLTLAWIHAGAIGVVAAMEADRGEMAGAEWAWLRQTACPLGELPGLSQRLAFTSLPETWSGMPRQRAGARRSLALVDVMLRGQLSRALFGDPSLRLLEAPLDPASTETHARKDTRGGVVVEVRATGKSFTGEGQFLFTNTITTNGFGDRGFTEHRLWGRTEVPSDLAGRLGRPEVVLQVAGSPVEPLRSLVRHEVWGGKRYVCVQVDSADPKLLGVGSRATFTFPVSR